MALRRRVDCEVGNKSTGGVEASYGVEAKGYCGERGGEGYDDKGLGFPAQAVGVVSQSGIRARMRWG